MESLQKYGFVWVSEKKRKKQGDGERYINGKRKSLINGEGEIKGVREMKGEEERKGERSGDR